MANKKECLTCEIYQENGCLIENDEGLRNGGCGAWIEKRKTRL